MVNDLPDIGFILAKLLQSLSLCYNDNGTDGGLVKHQLALLSLVPCLLLLVLFRICSWRYIALFQHECLRNWDIYPGVSATVDNRTAPAKNSITPIH
jgi:hypothetical protein